MSRLDKPKPIMVIESTGAGNKASNSMCINDEDIHLIPKLEENEFWWLKSILLITCMSSLKFNGNNTCCNYLCTIISVSFEILCMIAFGILRFLFIKDSALTIQVGYEIIGIAGIIIGRIISVYYFVFYYNKPWKMLNEYKNVKGYHNFVRNISIRLKLYIFFYLLGIISNIMILIFYSGNDNIYVNISYVFVYIYGILLPLGLSQCVISIIFFKYQLFLKHNIQTFDRYINRKKYKLRGSKIIKNDNQINIHYMLTQYKKTYNQFSREWVLWQWFLIFYLLSMGYLIWIEITSTRTYNNIGGYSKLEWWLFIMTGLFYFLPFIELMISGSNFTIQYKNLEVYLWECDQFDLAIHNINDINYEASLNNIIGVSKSHHLLSNNNNGIVNNETALNINSRYKSVGNALNEESLSITQNSQNNASTHILDGNNNAHTMTHNPSDLDQNTIIYKGSYNIKTKRDLKIDKFLDGINLKQDFHSLFQYILFNQLSPKILGIHLTKQNSLKIFIIFIIIRIIWYNFN